ncbi:MAG: class 1 fructose-bisphosphatase [Pseudomonadota bacterium]
MEDAFTTLQDYLAAWARGDARRTAIGETLLAITDGARAIATIIARGSLAGALAATRGSNSDGDAQKELDLRANDALIETLARAPVYAFASEELEDPVTLNDKGSLCVALDPLDGSSNIENNIGLGTIFSVLPAPLDKGDLVAAFLRPGCEQVAAGYVLYGASTLLVLTVGEGVCIFTLDPERRVFCLTARHVQIAPHAREFAINAANYRHWDARVRQYVDDCLAGADGPREEDCNMRWIASLVAECHRILMRSGVYLYPADRRAGYEAGRLRLVYEANPISWLMEEAGGAATTGAGRILDVVPSAIHQRIPFIFGARSEVARIARYLAGPLPLGERSPLFQRRGLFTA